MTGGLQIETRRGAEPPGDWAGLLGAAGVPSVVHSPVWHRAQTAHHPRLESLWVLARLDGRPAAGLSALVSRRGPFRTLAGHVQGLPLAPLVDPSLPAETADACLAGLLEAAEADTPAWRRSGAAWTLGADWAGRLGPGLLARGHRRVVEPVATLPLTDDPEDFIRERVVKNRRQERNQGLARGAEVGWSEDPAVVSEFRPIYAEAARRWGIAPQPAGLLEDLLRDGEGRWFLVTVRADGELLGAHLCFRDGGTVTAWIGASRFDRKRLHPATLLIWADVVEGCRRGARRLDLGGHGGQAGVAGFKRLFGVDVEERVRFERRNPVLDRLRGRR